MGELTLIIIITITFGWKSTFMALKNQGNFCLVLCRHPVMVFCVMSTFIRQYGRQATQKKR